jgi:hypothetical protein
MKTVLKRKNIYLDEGKIRRAVGTAYEIPFGEVS